MKERIYNFLAKYGMKFLIKVFPEFYAQEPLAPTDRYIEYYYAIKYLPMDNVEAKLLDVGSSGSMLPLIYSAMRFDVTSLDIRKYPILDRLQFKINHKQESIIFYFEKEKFDYISCISTIEHIGLGGRHGEKAHPGADYLALHRIYQALKPNGTIVLTFPVADKERTYAPYHRVYDFTILNRIEELFDCIELKYFRFNKAWREVTFKEALVCPRGLNDWTLTVFVGRKK